MFKVKVTSSATPPQAGAIPGLFICAAPAARTSFQSVHMKKKWF